MIHALISMNQTMNHMILKSIKPRLAKNSFAIKLKFSFFSKFMLFLHSCTKPASTISFKVLIFVTLR